MKAFAQSRLLGGCAALALTWLAAGCAVVPDTIVKQPLNTTPPSRQSAAGNQGAIFQGSYFRPIFEDRRARLAGDALTVVINEKTVAGRDQAGGASKSGSAAAAVPTIPGVGPGITSRLGVSASNAVKYEDKGSASSSNNFTGTIGVTVVEVLANGNLVVAGEKQVAMDKGAEFIRFSGVVNPDTIGQGNVVSSLQVADARVEYRSSARVDAADVVSQFSRFFLSVLPF
jgi:flagellar L-ring protein precursor FlgH